MIDPLPLAAGRVATSIKRGAFQGTAVSSEATATLSRFA